MDSEQSSPWKGQHVLITGVCGTVGSELFHQILAQNPGQITGLDNNESELFFMMERHRNNPGVSFSLGDVRDRDKLTRIMRVDVVLHAAALKHVILCEQSPRDAIQTNIIGVQNIVDAADACQVRRVLFTSSDKAVNPTNVMGTSKLMGERLMTAANAARGGAHPIFASTRFGNVLGSRGSVIPLFRRQIAAGGPITLTDPNMTRFIMTLADAVRLVMESTFLARGGEVFVTKMPVVRIADLAWVMRETLAPQFGFTPEQIEICVIGPKPGEKMYEELMNDEETRRTVELPDYFVVLPALRAVQDTTEYTYADVLRDRVDRPYNSSSEAWMTREELRSYLFTHKLLEEESDANPDPGR
ncbi:MAG: polysaccharide biosynthesis protein [Anaerolineales bacterium]|nr:polysaccharide biosynthesis protein [Anaerolineales bacterium]